MGERESPEGGGEYICWCRYNGHLRSTLWKKTCINLDPNILVSS